MISSSKIAQPMHWAAFRAVGSHEPRCPSGARISTIAGTRASAPIIPARPSIAFPIRLPDQDREERLRQRQRGDEVRAGDEHEQRDAEVPPQEAVVEQPEHAQPVGDRLDSPGGRPLHAVSAPPFAGITRIRSCGCDLSPASGTPVARL